jgi:hypothetical protein
LSFPNPALSDPRDEELKSLKREIEALKKRDEDYRRALDEMNERLERALSTASEQPVADGDTVSPREALDAALEATKTPEETAQDAATDGTPNTDVWNRRIGPTNLRLIDISADILFAGGGSTADDDELEELDGGAHDPNKNGFTLQGAELSLSGAVDSTRNRADRRHRSRRGVRADHQPSRRAPTRRRIVLHRVRRPQPAASARVGLDRSTGHQHPAVRRRRASIRRH